MSEVRKINLNMFGVIYFILFVIPIALNEQKPFLKFPKLGDTFGEKMLLDAGIGVFGGFLIVLVSWLLTKFTKMFRDLIESLKMLLGPLTLVEIFFIAAFSSIAEEFFFRGLIQAKLGIIPATIMFGLMHSGPGKKYLPWTAFAIVTGGFLGWTYHWRENLIVPIIAHFVVNFVNLTLLQKIKFLKQDGMAQ